QGIRSFLLGFLAIFFLYALPVVGLVTWAIVGVFGIGAAWRTFMAGLRRERPAKVPKPSKNAKPIDPVAPPSSAAADPAPAATFSTFVPEPPPPATFVSTPPPPPPAADWLRSMP